MSVAPITHLSAPEEQHMLFLFLPLKTGGSPAAVPALRTILSGHREKNGSVSVDPRTVTGVHFYMVYALLAGEPATSPLPFPTFQLPPPNPETGSPRDLAVVISIYDADFVPYIKAFTNDPTFTPKLDALLEALDETGFIDPSDPTSAKGIHANGGVFKNPDDFITLLMRYNWADPTIPATQNNAEASVGGWKYYLGATFPGLTNSRLLNQKHGYPSAAQLWPVTGNNIVYAPSTPPPAPKAARY
jgi:hypothetical protein